MGDRLAPENRIRAASPFHIADHLAEDGVGKFFLDLLAGLTPSVLLGVLVFTMISFFIPKRILTKINIAKLDNKTANRMGFLLISSFSLLIGILMVDLYNSGLKPFYNDYMLKLNQENRLDDLTNDEMIILKYYVERNTISRWFCQRELDGVVITLERDGLLFLAHKREIMGEDWYCYNIERWAFFYLKRHPELLKPTT
jgi:hypothetical protein